MKALKIIGIILLILLAAFLIIGLFLPKSSYTERSQQINAPAELIFEQIVNLRNWEAWSPFAEADTAMQIDYGDQVSGVGASYTWTGAMGTGELSITGVEEFTSIDYAILFDAEKEAKGQWLIEETGEGFKLTWTFGVPELDYPLGRYYGLFLDAAMDPFMVSGLNKIKEIAEAAALQPVSSLGEISLEEVAPMPILAIRDSITVEEMEAFYGQSYGALMAFAQANQIMISGAPLSVALMWNETGTSLMEAALPIMEMMEVSENEYAIYSRILEGGQMAVVTHYGPYDAIGNAYEAIEAFMAAEGYAPAGAPFEVYVIDPSTEPDASKWETKVYWPIIPAE
jgi:effector-binding domain-containing protein